MSVSAELTQKPDSPFGDPEVGQERHFTLTEKGDFTKAKNEKSDSDYGQPYKITSVERKKDWNSEKHGTFHQWNLSLEPLSAQEDAAGGVGEARESSNGSSSPVATSDNGVHWGLALKLASYRINDAHATADDDATHIAAVADLARKFYPLVVTGAADPKGPWMEAEAPPVDTAESVQADQTTDADIPF